METFNKNWFLTAILIIIFFILGLLVGKTCNKSKNCTNKSSCSWTMKGDDHHGMMKHKKVFMMKGGEVLHEIEEMGDSVEVKVEVKKRKKAK